MKGKAKLQPDVDWRPGCKCNGNTEEVYGSARNMQRLKVDQDINPLPEV